jgi:hypothetical protein
MVWKTLVGCLAVGAMLSGCSLPSIEETIEKSSVYRLCTIYVYQPETKAKLAAAELKRRGMSPSECMAITAGD